VRRAQALVAVLQRHCKTHRIQYPTNRQCPTARLFCRQIAIKSLIKTNH
jgi:cystathionine beta-lyase/cystathionine gamma-synthase